MRIGMSRRGRVSYGTAWIFLSSHLWQGGVRTGRMRLVLAMRGEARLGMARFIFGSVFNLVRVLRCYKKLQLRFVALLH